MFNNKKFLNINKETHEFSDKLYKFIILNNQININEDLIGIYNNYDRNLRTIYKRLIECNEDIGTKDKTLCINAFSDNFDSLRSSISKEIESNRK